MAAYFRACGAGPAAAESGEWSLVEVHDVLRHAAESEKEFLTPAGDTLRLYQDEHSEHQQQVMYICRSVPDEFCRNTMIVGVELILSVSERRMV